MGEHHYDWEEGRIPPEIGDHSVAKHRVLHEYLRQYISILTSDPRRDNLRLMLVDGFAGGGLYRRERTGELHEGSPFVLLRTAQEAQAEAQARRTKSFRLLVDFVFVEAKAAVCSFLRQSLRDRGFDPERDGRVKVVHGNFDASLDGILDLARTRQNKYRRTIFLLDQYGYSAVTMASLRKIFHEMPNAEVILNFAVDHMIDFMLDDPKTHAMLSRIGLQFDVAAARELMVTDRLLGYARVQKKLHRHIFEESGAAYYTPFYVKPKESSRAYWLIHLSGHARARDAMAAIHWKMPNTFIHFGGSGLEMFGYRSDEDPEVTKSLPFLFADDDRQNTILSLARDIRERLYRNRDGEKFETLFAQTCNGTPGTRGLMAEAVHGLVREGALLIKNDQGRQRRDDVQIEDDDVIVPPSQILLFPRNS